MVRVLRDMRRTFAHPIARKTQIITQLSVARQRGNYSNKKLSRNLVGTLTSHWRPLSCSQRKIHVMWTYHDICNLLLMSIWVSNKINVGKSHKMPVMIMNIVITLNNTCCDCILICRYSISTACLIKVHSRCHDNMPAANGTSGYVIKQLLEQWTCITFLSLLFIFWFCRLIMFWQQVCFKLLFEFQFAQIVR